MKWLQKADSKAMVHLFEKPGDIQIVVVGGQAGKSSLYGVFHPANPYIMENSEDYRENKNLKREETASRGSFPVIL